VLKLVHAKVAWVRIPKIGLTATSRPPPDGLASPGSLNGLPRTLAISSAFPSTTSPRTF
jgi:hypothetical protein